LVNQSNRTFYFLPHLQKIKTTIVLITKVLFKVQYLPNIVIYLYYFVYFANLFIYLYIFIYLCCRSIYNILLIDYCKLWPTHGKFNLISHRMYRCICFAARPEWVLTSKLIIIIFTKTVRGKYCNFAKLFQCLLS